MKKIICMMITFLLVGCSSNGSFDSGIKDFQPLIQYVNTQVENGDWDFGLLQEESLSQESIAEDYQLDVTRIEEAFVYPAISMAQISEIAFFLVEEAVQSIVEEAIAYRKQQLHEQWDTYIEDAKEIIDNACEGRIGKYYYFIVGIDAEKMVNYISNY